MLLHRSHLCCPDVRPRLYQSSMVLRRRRRSSPAELPEIVVRKHSGIVAPASAIRLTHALSIGCRNRQLASGCSSAPKYGADLVVKPAHHPKPVKEVNVNGIRVGQQIEAGFVEDEVVVGSEYVVDEFRTKEVFRADDGSDVALLDRCQLTDEDLFRVLLAVQVREEDSCPLLAIA